MTPEHKAILDALDGAVRPEPPEFWWVYSPMQEEWAGLRIAALNTTVNGSAIVVFFGEIDRRRIGLRVWEDIEQTECWRKIAPIPIPSKEMIRSVMFDWEPNKIETIKCPQCGLVSHNKHDIREGYCGFCHKFHADMAEHAAAVHPEDR